MSVREEMRGYLFSSPRITHSIKPVAGAVHPVCLPSKSVSKLYGEESEAGGGLISAGLKPFPAGSAIEPGLQLCGSKQPDYF